ncbi:hypothetical protein Scep_018472 [Stephania cephalantha]|uniref:non-specific serine/threonine protein kinase n=1 Tax=Stephania cephalantha TaxID=152367 RepID=A0AAP0I950_9MAGN
MMGLVNLTKLAIFCLLCLLYQLLLQSAYAQEGIIRNNGKCENITTAPVKDNSYDTARIFGTSSTGSKWCYNLTTIKSEDYLIRGTFINGISSDTTPDTVFDVSISATIIGQVNSSSTDLLEVEGVLRATDNYTNFCLVRRHGNPYLSKLELRPLKDLFYFNNHSSAVLKLVSRVDVGNTIDSIRYPLDRSDRIWKNSEIKIETANSISNSSIIVHGANTTVPLQVLQTASIDLERLDFSLNNLGKGDSNYLIHIYFLELNDSLKTGERVFDVMINGEKQYDKFDILGNGAGATNYRELVFSVSANEALNMSMVKSPGASLGPICNAYEIFQVLSLVQGTHQADLDKAVELRDELASRNPENEVLASWSGDPCLPLQWEGFQCEPNSDGSFVIVSIDVSSNGLKGPIPTVVAELTHLKYLDVSHNELMGPVPESLAFLPHLTKLYFGCNTNSESNRLPSSLANRPNLTTDSGICGDQSSPRLYSNVLIGSIAGGSVLFTVALGVIFACFCRWKVFRRKMNREHPKISLTHLADTPYLENAIFSLPSTDDLCFKSECTQNFTLQCLEFATRKYDTLIGEGGFGSVYRGTLPDGQEVAVKVGSATSTQGTREFENELNLLSAIRHENLVPLLGYCCENDQQILVYPFMSNGSLQDRLYGEASKRKILDWPTRISIALGLFYLHTFAGRGVIHRDVKSSNILLDHSMCAKVADFGFSKYAPQEGDSGASLEVRGTAGYLDPEYYSTQRLSSKSDVFSFGVVLLEIISGREPLDVHRPRNEWSLVEWAKPFIRESKIEDIVDPNIKGGYHAEAMWRVVEVALACIEPFSTYRPCMEDIVRELEDALIIENNASEYMKSIDSFGGSNRFPSIEKKITLPVTPSSTEPSPILTQGLPPLQPR